MYDELVKALRGCVLSKPCDACPYYDPNGPTKECATMNIAAADAIEELSMKLHGDEAAIAGMKREIERMVVSGNKPCWIPVTERLPESVCESYLCLTDTGYHCEARWTNNVYGLWKSDNNWGWSIVDVPQYCNITHWMPLPEPPRGKICNTM